MGGELRFGRPAQAGQAAIESAMVMPLMVFFTLGLVQLTMVQHAKLMTEYAAFQAARAGIVWNGNNERMHDAAVMALLPTLGRTDDLAQVGQRWAWQASFDAVLAPLAPGGAVPTRFNGSSLFGLVRVDTVNPTALSSLDTLWKLRGGAHWQELDFDGPDGYPEVPGLERFIARFFNLRLPDAADQTYRRATLLQLRLRSLYELKVPFANQVLFLTWFATNAQVLLWGALDRSSTQAQNLMGPGGGTQALAGAGRGISHQKGYPTVVKPELLVLWKLAHGEMPALGRRYFLPLTATYSMRMQSNFHRKWVMHSNPGWGL